MIKQSKKNSGFFLTTEMINQSNKFWLLSYNSFYWDDKPV